MSVTPALVSFRRMIVDKDFDGTAVDGVANRELLHAVAALYDQSLPDVTRDIIYTHICKPSSRSVLFIRDAQGAIREASERGCKRKVSDFPDDDVTSKETENGANDDEDSKSLFDDVFSDSDDEEQEDEEEEDDDDEEESEDFSNGCEDFVRAVKRRRRLRQKGTFTQESVGIESRLAAAASYERLVGKEDDGIIQLSLISVRKRFRKRGLGKRLINMIKDPTVMGSFKCIIAYVDHGAIEFFRKHNFTDDVVVSSRFKHLAENWENSTFMCYLPPYSDIGPVPQLTSKVHQDALVLFQLDADIEDWRKSAVEVHQNHALLVQRLRNEMLRLTAQVRNQEEIILSLKTQLEQITQEKNAMEKEFDTFRSTSKSSYEATVSAMAERFLDLKMPEAGAPDAQQP
ncbi:uncharacterized protein [Oscarella lobularis]|uniref:uncharacterized protein n=1 Tax=Oscarella lobularis TaxID=121494 RepID=UPI003313416B